MNVDETRKILLNRQLLMDRWENAEQLRKEFPGLCDLLEGEFEPNKLENFNVYESSSGLVVSRRLIPYSFTGIAKKDGIIPSTIGLITPGSYNFNTGKNRETMTVLEGRLIASSTVKELQSSSILQPYSSIIAPAETTLNFETAHNIFYLCQYKQMKE